MFQLSMPDELFANQTLYRISGSVDKKLPGFAAQLRLAVVLPQPFSDLPGALKEMVEKLIVACKVDTKDVVYVDMVSSDISYQAIQTACRPEVILFFGDIAPSRNLQTLKRNMPYEFNGIKVLVAQSLEYIAKTPAEKSALWVGLQKLFNLK